MEKNNEIKSQEDLQDLVKNTCHYVQYVTLTNNSKLQKVALIFPQNELLAHPDYQKSPEEGCFCPRDLDEIGKCLTGCLKKVNNEINDEAEKISLAIIVGDKFKLDDGKITEKMESELIAIIDKYKTSHSGEDVYVIDLAENAK